MQQKPNKQPKPDTKPATAFAPAFLATVQHFKLEMVLVLSESLACCSKARLEDISQVQEN